MGDTSEKIFIGISGLIGAGKTTLATSLGEALDLPVHHEPVHDHAYLADFYADMKKYSFAMQVYLLTRRFEQHQQIIWQGQGGVQDRTVYEDSIFAKMLTDAGLMEPRDYKTYVDLFTHMSNFMRKPNVIVYLDVAPETALERIRKRGRECEAGITLEYLTALRDAYEAFIARISRAIPVIRVDWSEFMDPVELAARVVKEYHALQVVHTLKK